MTQIATSHLIYTEVGPHRLVASSGVLTVTVTRPSIENRARRVIGYDFSHIHVEVSLVVTTGGRPGPDDWDLLVNTYDNDLRDAGESLQQHVSELANGLRYIVNAPTSDRLYATLHRLIELLKKKRSSRIASLTVLTVADKSV